MVQGLYPHGNGTPLIAADTMRAQGTDGGGAQVGAISLARSAAMR